jgi:hypothetical protein
MCIACWIPKAKNTLRICNTDSFSTAAMVARTRLRVKLYVHCMKHYLYTWSMQLDKKLHLQTRSPASSRVTDATEQRVPSSRVKNCSWLPTFRDSLAVPSSMVTQLCRTTPKKSEGLNI